MCMKIAIHDHTGSFSDRWIRYCEENQVPYKPVNCYDSDIVTQLDDCKGLMWHWNQNDYKATLCARQLTISLHKKGIKVFPDINTAWHPDDKVGRKYLLEASCRGYWDNNLCWHDKKVNPQYFMIEDFVKPVAGTPGFF
jgi:hypothetical protein